MSDGRRRAWVAAMVPAVVGGLFLLMLALGGWALAQSTTDTAHAGRLAALEATGATRQQHRDRIVTLEANYTNIQRQLAEVKGHAAKAASAARRVEAAVIRIEAKLER